MFHEEQKGCHKGSRGTGELLYIDQHVLNDNKSTLENLAMAWIDYKNVYDMVPQMMKKNWKLAVRIYSQDQRMEFGLEKCAMLVMKSGKRHVTDGMEL